MTKIVTQTGKGSLIALSEDNDHKEATAGKVVTVGSNTTVSIAHQNDTIEVVSQVTVTLDTKVNITNALHTSDYKIKIVALHALGCTVDCAPADTFSDGTDTRALAQYEWIEIQTASASTDWNVVNSSNAVKLEGIRLSQLLRSDLADSAQGVIDFINGIKVAGTKITTSADDINNLATLTDLNDLVVGGSGLADGSITAVKLAANAVIESKIQGNAVTTAKIKDDAVTNAKLAQDSVNSANIIDNAVSAAHIASNAVGSSEIAANAVGNSEMADNAISQSEMQDNSVGNAELIDGSVDFQKLGNDSVRNQHLDNSSIDSTKLQEGSVGFGKLTDNSITAAKLTSTAVSDKIKDQQVGAVGTYAMMKKTTSGQLDPGDTISSGELRFCSANSNSSLILPTGTWRCMGECTGNTVADVTLFLRIS